MKPLNSPGPADKTPATVDDAAESASDIDAAMRAARVFLAVIAQSVAEVEHQVTSPQLRVLVLIATRGPQNLGAVAADLGVHPSNATRTCDRLVAAGLLDRRDNPADRRYLLLALSTQGKALVDRVMEHRRGAIAAVMNRMPTALRHSMGPVLDAFAEAAGDVANDDRFALALKEDTLREQSRPGI
ncbi:MarR family winged helix-turn-helix transcriptional regulator [Arthrobacter sp. GMC3]|uniref:MarR family winged helix-turn-helix transcriptional regulator n=1 Tax=Arthrobacter sp. GMC3 TaxID=2058894 RepID=UPI00215707E0|nr:MarR family transcriptional regulator [Arthrobacter sp. GMC3]